MADSYKEKMDKVRKEQKKRAELRKKTKLMTGGLDDGKVPLKKSKSSKLGSAQKSRGSKNPTSVFQDMKTNKKDTTKKKSDGRSFLQKYILGEKFQPRANTNKSTSALGGKIKNETTKKETKKVVSKDKKDNTKKSSTTEKYSSFGAAFKAARAKGIGTPFTYKGKKYTAVRATDIPKSIKSTKTTEKARQAERLKKFLNQKRKKK
tara:strand:+ start:64 stop:681 length:618 start_codon:yes stop_codon:yes gene_type:complete